MAKKGKKNKNKKIKSKKESPQISENIDFADPSTSLNPLVVKTELLQHIIPLEDRFDGMVKFVTNLNERLNALFFMLGLDNREAGRVAKALLENKLPSMGNITIHCTNYGTVKPYSVNEIIGG